MLIPTLIFKLGPSGLLVVIARKDLLTGEREMSICPGVMSWSAAAKSTPIQNIWNTPNVFGIRALQLVLEDCKAKGGVAAMRARATRRAWSVYDIIDASEGFYINDVEPEFQVNSAAKINSPAITKGKVNGPGRTIRAPPIAIKVDPMTKAIALRSALGSWRQTFLYCTF